MSESTSIDARTQNGHGDYHQPRPRKPTRIDLLKPQLSDDGSRLNGFKETGSGLSRYLYLPCACVSCMR